MVDVAGDVSNPARSVRRRSLVVLHQAEFMALPGAHDNYDTVQMTVARTGFPAADAGHSLDRVR